LEKSAVCAKRLTRPIWETEIPFDSPRCRCRTQLSETRDIILAIIALITANLMIVPNNTSTSQVGWPKIILLY
jgi:hypothetical protein